MVVPGGEALGCGQPSDPSSCVPALSSPTRIGRPVSQGLLGDSRRMRTAVTQRQLTLRAATRDASLRAPHTATKARLLPDSKREFCPGETETPRKATEKDILREERPRGRQLVEQASFILETPVARLAPPLPLLLHPPLPWACPSLAAPVASGVAGGPQ